MTPDTDCIERSILLNASRARVWQALTDPEEFGRWFGAHIAAKTFVAGERVQGRITHPGYEHFVWNAWIEKIEPQGLFAWR